MKQNIWWLCFVVSFIFVNPVGAEDRGRRGSEELGSRGDEVTGNAVKRFIGKTEGSPSPQVLNSPSHLSADLLVQANLRRVIGVEVAQTEDGLELILKTVAESRTHLPHVKM